jgi:hypothetical protein
MSGTGFLIRCRNILHMWLCTSSWCVCGSCACICACTSLQIVNPPLELRETWREDCIVREQPIAICFTLLWSLIINMTDVGSFWSWSDSSASNVSALKLCVAEDFAICYFCKRNFVKYKITWRPCKKILSFDLLALTNELMVLGVCEL